MTVVLLCALLSTRWSAVLQGTSLQTPDAAAFTTVSAQRGPGTPTAPAKGRLLIASRNLNDPNFAAAVILLLSYTAHGGAMGVIINRPTQVRLAKALPEVTELRDRPDRLFLGGPVAGNLMVLLIRSAHHRKPSQRIFGNVYASGSLAALRDAVGRNAKGDGLRAFAGYAGWGTGQLEREIGRGDWYVAPADSATIFDRPPEAIWPKLIERFSGEWTRKPTVPSEVEVRSAQIRRVA